MSNISTRFKSLVSDPSRCSDVLLADLAAVGMEVVDASNAFIMLMEATTHLASQNWTANALGLKRRYASLATEFTELYPHLAPKDIPDIFAKPTQTEIRLTLLVDNLLSNSVNHGSYREAIIPALTEIAVDDLRFSLERAISIKAYTNRIFKISYVDGGELYSDLAILNGPQNFTRMDGSSWLTFVVPVKQINYTQYTLSSIANTVFDHELAYVDQLSSIHVFYADNGYKPLRLTLSDRIYDPLTPCVVLTPDIDNQRLRLTIPRLFTINNIIGNVKVVVGTTKGDIDRVFTQYSYEDYRIGLDTDIYPIGAEERAFLNATVLCEIVAPLTGGRDGLNFLALRDRVVGRGFGHPNLPISRNEVTHKLNDHGLSILSYQEGVGGRTYLVTDDTPNPSYDSQMPTRFDLEPYLDFNRSLYKIPAKEDESLMELAKYQNYQGNRSRMVKYDTYLPIACLNVELAIAELEAAPYVRKFQTGYTLLPTHLFRVVGESLVPSSLAVSELDGLSPEAIMASLNQVNHILPLFHYDIRPFRGNWTISAWSMNLPSLPLVDRIEAEQANPNLFRRMNHQLFKTNTGYVLRLGVNATGLSPVNVRAWLRIELPTSTDLVDSGQSNVIHLPFNISSGEEGLILELELTCTWEFRDDRIGFLLNNVNYFLNSSMWASVVYCLATAPTNYSGALSNLIPDSSVAAMLHERMYLCFGEKLSHLWTNVRGVAGRIEYLQHLQDVPYVIETDSIYTTTAEAIPFTIGPDCKITYRPTVTTSTTVTRQGEVVYKHRQGDLVLDELGRPIITNTDGQSLRFDLLGVDAGAVFAEDADVIQQLVLVEQDLVHKCVRVLPELQKQMLERTNLYYRPLRTLGSSAISANGKGMGQVSLNISPTVNLTVSQTVYYDALVKKSLRDLTVQALNLSLTRSIISYDRILADLRQVYGGSVVSVSVTGLPAALYNSPIHLDDETALMVVGTSLIKGSDNKLTLTDSIVVNYILIA